MNYFPFHIGDYAAHTQRLSLMEDLAYRRLIDAYYLAERPLNGRSTDVAREIGMLEQLEAVEYVLEKFFVKCDEGYRNARCDKEIAHFRDKQNKASQAGKASAERRLNARSTSVGKKSTSVANPATDEQPTNNQEPLTSSSVVVGLPPTADPAPHSEILALWAEVIPEAVQPAQWTESRKQALRARWRESAKRQNLDYWRRLFTYIRDSDFLMGKEASQGRRPFAISLDWLLKQENFLKVIEGKFHTQKEQA